MCESKSFKVWFLQFLLLLILLLALILWLILRPNEPTCTITDLTVTPPPSNNATINYTLEIANHNKITDIFYDDVNLSFYYGKDSVGEKKLDPFYQRRDRKRQFVDHVDSRRSTWRLLIGGMMNKTTELRIRVSTRIRYRTWGMKSKKHGMLLGGSVRIGPDGKINGKKKKRKIKLHHVSNKWRIKLH